MKTLLRGMHLVALLCAGAALLLSSALPVRGQGSCYNYQPGPTQEDHYCDFQPQGEPGANDCYCEGNPGGGYDCEYTQVGEGGFYWVFAGCYSQAGDTCERWYQDCGKKWACDPQQGGCPNGCVEAEQCCNTMYPGCN